MVRCVDPAFRSPAPSRTASQQQTVLAVVSPLENCLRCSLSYWVPCIQWPVGSLCPNVGEILKGILASELLMGLAEAFTDAAWQLYFPSHLNLPPWLVNSNNPSITPCLPPEVLLILHEIVLEQPIIIQIIVGGYVTIWKSTFFPFFPCALYCMFSRWDPTDFSSHRVVL